MTKMETLMWRLVERRILSEWVVECQEKGERQKGEKIVRAYKKMLRLREEVEDVS